MIKILHTADWHVGRSFDLFEPEQAQRLARDRVNVIDRILGLAKQYDVDAVLCAGDLFDSPDPGIEWWRALVDSFERQKGWSAPIVLLPGNHDPLTHDSVYFRNHPFRSSLPKHIQVVDQEDFELPVGDEGVIYGAPCTSTAGDRDLALSLPCRKDGDNRIRIGLVHGSTFEMEGCDMNYPISLDAPMQRGLDYLAIGDTHSFREVANNDLAPIVYPSTPEPTSFKETEAGYVALVTFKRHGAAPRIRRERVARWTWKDVTVRSMSELRELAAQDLLSTVLRLKLDMDVNLDEAEQVEQTLASFRGTQASNPRTGAFVCDKTKLRIDVSGWEINDANLPDSLREAVSRLQSEAEMNPYARRGLMILRRLLHDTLSVG